MTDGKSTIEYAIRPVKADDLAVMREICIETSSLPLRNENDRRFLLLIYCDSYVDLTSDCFVAVDGNDRPIGYILCASDTRKFLRDFRKNTLPQIKELGLKYSVSARGICASQAICELFAPAHLHIDLTESARRQGVGTALMNTLKNHLSEQGISRVQLTCGSKNKAAIGFYKRNGFGTVFRGFGARVMRSKTD